MEIVKNCKVKFDDLFIIGEIISKLDISTMDLPENFLELDTKQKALSAFDLLIDNIANIKGPLYRLITSLTGIKDVGELELEEIVEVFMKIAENNDLEKVFTRAKELARTK